MEFRILGPLAVDNEREGVPLGGVKPRAVLAMLLLHANEPVSAERLAVALWGEDVPGGAVKTVQVHVSRLRKALGDPDVLTTTPAGWPSSPSRPSGAAGTDARRVEPKGV
jgi:DNA-binding SARP family transcriptional activator